MKHDGIDNLYPLQSFRTAWNIIGNKGIIFNIEGNEVMELSDVASEIWNLCDGSKTTGEICNGISKTYDIPIEQANFDVKEFISSFTDQNLLRLEKAKNCSFASDEYLTRKPIDQEVKQNGNSYSIDGETPLEGQLLGEISKLYIPYAVQIELTYRCNERCVHCYCVDDDNGNELTTSEIKKNLKELRNLGSLKLILTGGEPFLRKDIWEIIDYARELRYAIDIFTNAILIDDDVADKLAQAYVKSVQASIYSADPELHDEITKVKGSFFRTVNGLKKCKERNIPIAIKVPLMRNTAKGFKKIKQLANDLGAGLQMSVTISAKNDGDKSTHILAPNDEDIKEIFKDPDIIIGFEEPMDIGIRENLEAPACGAGNALIHINPYGFILPCVAIQEPGGNIREDSITNIWNEGEIFKIMRKTKMQDLPVCSKCSHLKYCTRCPGLALLEDGDLFGPSTNDCRVAILRHEALMEG